MKWCEFFGHTSIFLRTPEISHHFIPFYTILYHSTPFFFACVFAFSHRSHFFFLQMRPGGLRRSRVGLPSGGQVEYALNREAPRRRNDALAQVVFFPFARCYKNASNNNFCNFFLQKNISVFGSFVEGSPRSLQGSSFVYLN